MTETPETTASPGGEAGTFRVWRMVRCETCGEEGEAPEGSPLLWIVSHSCEPGPGVP